MFYGQGTTVKFKYQHKKSRFKYPHLFINLAWAHLVVDRKSLPLLFCPWETDSVFSYLLFDQNLMIFIKHRPINLLHNKQDIVQ